MNYGVYVDGGRLDVNGVNIVADAVMAILESPHNDQQTKQMALQIIAKSCNAEAPSNLSFSNMSINMESEPRENKLSVDEEDKEDIEDGWAE